MYCICCMRNKREPPKRKFIFNTSGLIFCNPILEDVKINCEIIVSPLIANEFSKKEIDYRIEQLNENDKEYVSKIIYRYLNNKNLAVNYRKGRKTAYAGEFELITLSKRLRIPIVIHDRRARRWAKMEHAEALHPIELPSTFSHKLSTSKLIEFLRFHCKMRYQPACDQLNKIQKPT